MPREIAVREAFINTQLSPYGRMFEKQASMLIYVDSINYLYPLGLSSWYLWSGVKNMNLTAEIVDWFYGRFAEVTKK